MVLAGLALSVSARTAAGTDLRGEAASDLKSLVLARAADVSQSEAATGRLRTEVDNLILERFSPKLLEVRRQVQAAEPLAGYDMERGDGLTVVLDDAPPVPAGEPVFDVSALIVHQQDLQAVINALWKGGATAVSLMDQRIIHTSGIKCVGSTVLVNGKVYSPPFVIKAIGPVRKMQTALRKDDAVRFFRDLASTFDLTYDVSVTRQMTILGYTGPTGVRHSQPID